MIEEPFVTRESILIALRPGHEPTEGPWRTLREKHKAASKGLGVDVRLYTGRLGGRVFLYSSLNSDAARAYRLREPELAQKFAACAQKLERTGAAKLIWKAVKRLADRMPRDPLSKEAPGELRRYIQLRRGWQMQDADALAREWLVQSSAWLDHSGLDRSELVDAIEDLSLQAEKVRTEILVKEVEGVCTFYGFVRMMDRTRAALEGESGEVVVLQRSELERRGLATVGQPVALLQEAMPGGGFYSLPMPAAMLEPPAMEGAGPAIEVEFAREGSTLLNEVGPRDSEWLKGAFAKDPSVVVVGPLQVE